MPDKTQAEFIQVCSEMLHLQDEIKSAHGILEQGPDAEMEEELRSLFFERDRRVEKVGRLVLKHLLAGGTLALTHLDEAAEEADEAPEEAEEPEITPPEEVSVPSTPEPEPTYPTIETLLETEDWTQEDLQNTVQEVLDQGVYFGERSLLFLLAPHYECLRKKKEWKNTLVKHLRRIRKEMGLRDDVEDTNGLPPESPAYTFAKDKHAVIVGGDPRQTTVDRLKDVFGFKEVEWKQTTPRRAASLKNRIQNGKIDMVLLLARFMWHADQRLLESNCQSSHVPIITVHNGYGSNQIRIAIERYLGYPPK